MMTLNNLKVSWKIWLPTVVFAIALVGVASVAGIDMKANLVSGHEQKVQNLVESASSIIEYYSDQEKAGNLSRDEAQARAKDAIRAQRYGDNEYFWIHDMDHNMVMHPIKPALEGKNLKGLKDKKGNNFFAQMVDVVKANGAGFVDYYWPKPGLEEAVRKTSYVKLQQDWGWIVGSGLYVDDVDAAFSSTLKTFVAMVVAALVIAGGLSFLIARNMTKGLGVLSTQMAELSSGNLDVEITGRRRGDELGDMAKALNVFKDNAIEANTLRAEQETNRQNAENERKQAMLTMADDLQGRMKEAAEQMNTVVERLGLSANTMQNNAEATSRESTSVASISGQTSQNVQTVAAATEELNASSSEIGRQVEQTNATAQAAAHEAIQTNEVIQGLSGAAGKIGEVVSMIQDIAEQTNLLALNATIEAARAGEAGKGFAVVASEVKNLANQTAKATDQVAQQIATIQSETDRAVGAIGGITNTINEVRDAASAIAAAVEEQHAAIQEISRNVQEAARGTDEISNHIAAVSNDASETMTSAQDVKSASDEILASSRLMDDTMAQFLSDMRGQAHH